MTSKKKLKNKSGFSLLELVIVIGLMAVVTIPAYMSLVNGYKLFHDESTYQSVLSDVQAFNKACSILEKEGIDFERGSEVVATELGKKIYFRYSLITDIIIWIILPLLTLIIVF